MKAFDVNVHGRCFLGEDACRGGEVVVPAAAGSVGSLAVQLAREAGATVISTASPANHAYVRSLGATLPRAPSPCPSTRTR